MNWECCIEYFIDCLLAPCWPAWHAKSPARWRRHVTLHQSSHPWGSPAFPVNKLAHSGGGREAGAQGHWAWAEENIHTYSPVKNTTQPWLQYELPWSKPLNPLKGASELSRPKTSVLITAPLSMTIAHPTGRHCLPLARTWWLIQQVIISYSGHCIIQKPHSASYQHWWIKCNCPLSHY